MHLQDGYTAVNIRIVYRHLAVKAAGAQQCRIQNIPTVGSCHDNDALIDGETIHFHQQLIQGLLPFIMTAAKACATMPTHSINFIDKDNGRSSLLCRFKQVTHPAGTNAHEHFHKVRAGNGEEGHACFPGYCLGQQGFARAGRAYQQHALGNAGTHLDIVLRIAEEVHHFLQLFLLLIRTGNIGKGHLVLAGLLHSGTALAKAHHLAVAACLSTHHQVPEQQEDHRDHNHGQELHPPRGLHRRTVFHREAQVIHRHFVQCLALFVGFHLPHRVNKVAADGGFKVILPIREVGCRHGGVCLQAHQGRAPNGDPAHLTILDHLQQLRIFDALIFLGAHAAVKQNGNNQEGGNHHHIAHQSL